MKGPDTLVKNDYIIINKFTKEYGRVFGVIGKTVYYNLVHINREWNIEHRRYDSEVCWTTPIHMHPIYIARQCQRRYETMLQMGKLIDYELKNLLPSDILFKESPYSRYKTEDTKCISIWKCEKVGHNPNWESEFEINKHKILTEIHLRQSIWLKSICLRYVDMKAFSDFYNLKYNIIKKEKPPQVGYSQYASHGELLNYDDLWDCVKDAIDIYFGNPIDEDEEDRE